MNKYHHRKNAHRKSRRQQILFISVILFIVVGLGGVGYVAYGFWKDATQSQEVQSSKVIEAGRYEGEIKETISNEMFEFQSSRDWKFSRSSSRVGAKYEFVSQRNTLVNYVLTVYIGEVPPDQATAYIVPIEVKDNKIVPGEVSPHCNHEEEVPGTFENEPREYEGIPFMCNRENNREIAMVGVPGQGTSVVLANGEGEDVAVTFVFEDVGGRKMRADVFSELLPTFRLK